ncbi:MAG: hypothetical protein IPP51_05500 [Bacteroidetes bacterium]|nr:hypothetical protein [Bacteroidota bacterium]
MEAKRHYATVSEALTKLKEEGFTTDFNLEENCFVCQSGKFLPDQQEIVDIYRYEGNSDPGDEAVVYAIQSDTGVKGVFVNGYGISADRDAEAFINSIPIRK